MRPKNQSLPFSILCLIAFSLFQAVCRPELTEEKLTAKARAIHDRVLTVDTHCDTPSRLPGGTWDIGVRHEPGERASGKVDLPRMAEGGLDALLHLLTS
jgi:membrane dipeptidase